VTPRLLRAYRKTEYTVAGLVIRIGQRSPALDALLARYGAREGVLITAWNPRSRRMPEGWNRRAASNLTAMLRGVPLLPAAGRLRRWQEAHVLALGPAARFARPARRFRQNAIVRVASRHVAKLLLIS
jgi:Protein of unknown function (DUF3293)